MDLLRTYSGDDESDSSGADKALATGQNIPIVSAAPDVPLEPCSDTLKCHTLLPLSLKSTIHFQDAKQVYIDSSAFDAQYNNFGTTGIVADPTNGSYRTARPPRPRKRPRSDPAKKVNYNGPEQVVKVSNGILAGHQDSLAAKNSPPPENILVASSKQSESVNSGFAAQVMVPKSEWLFPAFLEMSSSMKTSWVEPPGHARTFAELEQYTPYIPKRLAHCYSNAHRGGVGAVRFFPGYGHLLLSAGLDGVIKIWDVQTHRKCMRSYTGHSKGVRDVCFTNDGRSFLSAGYDRSILLWDTETGRVLGSFGGNRAIPYCVCFHSDNDKQNEFLAGCSDKKVIQLDIRSGNKIIQSYDQHMGAVNAISFIDDYRRFVSSADDKVLRVWEYGIPVVIKYVSDPTMHSMPVLAVHPNGKFMSCQSMDNTIPVYSILDRFKLNRKKVFDGHLVAGYACGLSYSPNGRFLVSGDSMGRVFFWDWKTTKMYRALKAHEGVSIDVAWHPTEPSCVATCGWDGDVKLWD